MPDDGVRRNELIHAREVRVIGAEGEQLGILQRNEAIAMAREIGCDLVEVSSNATPPVCRIMDYGKFKYEQQKKKQDAKKRQAVVQVKEIKVRPKTDEHDYETKLKHIRSFLEDEGVKSSIRIVALKSWKGSSRIWKTWARSNRNPVLKAEPCRCLWCPRNNLL